MARKDFNHDTDREYLASKSAVFSGSVQCGIKSIEYFPFERRGELKMAEGNSSDMGGCIELFESIDPAVVRIDAISGSKPDMRYLRSSDGKWVSHHI
jgi:hypothetical protein